jgi:3,4-dihydroxy 2-butanone 4-phosphate synthase/GTP cyclohydrolase II
MMHPNLKIILDDLRNGKMVILTDHPDRENEGDLIVPAEFVTPEIMSFMIRHGSGIVCLTLTPEKVKQLGLPLMVTPANNKSQQATTFTVSIEAARGIVTGVSAQDRVHTILTAVNETATSADLVSPGHVFPLQAKKGGVLERQGHTEGSVDLARLAGCAPSAVICELMNEDGTMMKGEALMAFAEQFKINMISIDEVIAHRMSTENMIEAEASSDLPLNHYGNFKMTVMKERFNAVEHMVFEKPSVDKTKPLLVRVHSSCVTGDLFGSQRCDCQAQLHESLSRIAKEGGMMIYLAQEGRGIGLFNKIKSYALQDSGLDTVEANHALNFPTDLRQYHVAASILRNAGAQKIRLLTNNPNKLSELEKYGITCIHETMPVFKTEFNKHYLQTKKTKLNHFINQII